MSDIFLSDSIYFKLGIFFVLWFALVSIFLFVRSLVFTRLEKWAALTSQTWDEALLLATRGPIKALLVVWATSIASQVLPFQFRTHPYLVYSIKILFILSVIWALDRALVAIGNLALRENVFGQAVKGVLLKTIRLLLFSIGLLVTLDTLGVSITPILASLGVGSLAVALALQDTLGNFFSGFYLLLDRPIRVGDFVDVVEENVSGYVERIGWRSTHIRLLENNVVILPNTKVANARIKNYEYPDQQVAVLVNLGVSYGSDLEHVERITVEVAREIQKSVEGAVAEFEPFIRYNNFGESSIDFTVILRARLFVSNYLIKHEFIKKLHARYKQEKIEIPFPQRVLHFALTEGESTKGL